MKRPPHGSESGAGRRRGEDEKKEKRSRGKEQRDVPGSIEPKAVQGEVRAAEARAEERVKDATARTGDLDSDLQEKIQESEKKTIQALRDEEERIHAEIAAVAEHPGAEDAPAEKKEISAEEAEQALTEFFVAKGVLDRRDKFSNFDEASLLAELRKRTKKTPLAADEEKKLHSLLEIYKQTRAKKPQQAAEKRDEKATVKNDKETVQATPVARMEPPLEEVDGINTEEEELINKKAGVVFIKPNDLDLIPDAEFEPVLPTGMPLLGMGERTQPQKSVQENGGSAESDPEVKKAEQLLTNFLREKGILKSNEKYPDLTDAELERRITKKKIFPADQMRIATLKIAYKQAVQAKNTKTTSSVSQNPDAKIPSLEDRAEKIVEPASDLPDIEGEDVDEEKVKKEGKIFSRPSFKKEDVRDAEFEEILPASQDVLKKWDQLERERQNALDQEAKKNELTDLKYRAKGSKWQTYSSEQEDQKIPQAVLGSLENLPPVKTDRPLWTDTVEGVNMPVQIQDSVEQPVSSWSVPGSMEERHALAERLANVNREIGEFKRTPERDKTEREKLLRSMKELEAQILSKLLEQYKLRMEQQRGEKELEGLNQQLIAIIADGGPLSETGNVTLDFDAKIALLGPNQTKVAQNLRRRQLECLRRLDEITKKDRELSDQILASDRLLTKAKNELQELDDREKKAQEEAAAKEAEAERKREEQERKKQESEEARKREANKPPSLGQRVWGATKTGGRVVGTPMAIGLLGASGILRGFAKYFSWTSIKSAASKAWNYITEGFSTGKKE